MLPKEGKLYMNRQEKTGYIAYLRGRYGWQKRKTKSAIIEQICTEFGCHRKHALRLMGKRQVGRPQNQKRPGRKSEYQGYEFILILRKVWEATGRMCSKRLKAAMPEWLPYVAADLGGISLDIQRKLLAISAPTIDRILCEYRKERGLSATRPGSVLKHEIPIQGSVWNITEPGFMESDTVSHCGGSLFGDFVNTLTLTDIATTWTETRGMWGKSASVVITHLLDIEASLPFKLLGFDSDGGSEFINYAVFNYLKERQTSKPIIFTRSRPYQKNDNAHVEQKNWSISRRYLGYDRLDFIELAVLVNQYFREIVCPLNNHFHPSFKLYDKIQKQSRFKRIYKPPMTPYQRVMESTFVDDAVKQMLKIEHLKLNPVALTKKAILMRKKIDLKLKELQKARTANAYTPDSKAVDLALALGAVDAPRSRLITPMPSAKYRLNISNSSEALIHL